MGALFAFLNGIFFQTVALLENMSIAAGLSDIPGLIVGLCLWQLVYVGGPIAGPQIVWAYTEQIVERNQEASHRQAITMGETARARADAAYQEWRRLAERICQQRIDAIYRGDG